MELKELVTESASGDASAFRALFDELQGPIFAFIRCRVPTRDDALDQLQETFMELWKALTRGNFQYSSDAEFRGFVYTIARRKVARLYRFYKPAASLEDLVVADESPVAEPGESAVLISSLEKLPENDREIIALRYFSGLHISEIAELLGKGEGAVKVRLHRALGKLKNILGYEKE